MKVKTAVKAGTITIGNRNVGVIGNNSGSGSNVFGNNANNP
jgi:allophanate hydrolase subunit 1